MISTLSFRLSQLLPFKYWTTSTRRVSSSSGSLFDFTWSGTNLEQTTKTDSGSAVIITGAHTKNSVTHLLWNYGSSNNNTINRPLSQSCKFYIKY